MQLASTLPDPTSAASGRGRCIEQRYAILLTATVAPGSYGDQVRRNDPRERLSDYESALHFWTNLRDDRIGAVVFCENSGWDLGCFQDLASRARIPVEFVSAQDNARPSGMHYGYSELGLIDHAITVSQGLTRYRYFVKVTGRLTFPSITRLLDALPEGFDAVVDHRRRYRHEKGVPTRARTQLMLFRTRFYCHYLLGSRAEMPGNCTYIEEFIAQKLTALSPDHDILKRFPIECPPLGIGGNGTRFNTLPMRCKNAARGMMRRLMPTLWL